MTSSASYTPNFKLIPLPVPVQLMKLKHLIKVNLYFLNFKFSYFMVVKARNYN